MPECKKCGTPHYNFQKCAPTPPPAKPTPPGALKPWAKPDNKDRGFGPPVN